MTPEKLIDAIGEADDVLLQKTAKGAAVSPRRLTGILAAAACFCLIVGIGIFAGAGNGIFAGAGKGRPPLAEPAAEAPLAESAAEDGTDFDFIESEEAPAEEPSAETGDSSVIRRPLAVVVRSEQIDEATERALADYFLEHSMDYYYIPPDEVWDALMGGCDYLFIDDAMRKDYASFEKEFPKVQFVDPDDALNGSLDGYLANTGVQWSSVGLNGAYVPSIVRAGIDYVPADRFAEWPQMHCHDDGTTDGIQLREGENTVRIDGIQYVLAYSPFRMPAGKTQDSADTLYVPAQELGELLHYDASVDPGTGLLCLAQNDRTWESFRGTRALVLEYGPGTTMQELKEHLSCLHDSQCPLGTLTDLDGLPYGEQLVCIVLNPGSFSDFSSLQEMQYEMDDRDRPPMCIALDPANLGELTEKDCSDWCWNLGLPFYYRLTEQTAQYPEEQLNGAISDAWYFMDVATIEEPLFAACPEQCRELLAERFAYIFSDDGSVWYRGTQMDTVVRQTVAPGTSAEELLDLVRGTFEN